MILLTDSETSDLGLCCPHMPEAWHGPYDLLKTAREDQTAQGLRSCQVMYSLYNLIFMKFQPDSVNS